MKRVLVAAMLAALSLEVAADAAIVTVPVPVRNCTVSVWGPDFVIYSCPPTCPIGIYKYGDTGASTTCP